MSADAGVGCETKKTLNAMAKDNICSYWKLDAYLFCPTTYIISTNTTSAHSSSTVLPSDIALEVIRSTDAAASGLACRWLIDQIRQAVCAMDAESVDEVRFSSAQVFICYPTVPSECYAF